MTLFNSLSSRPPTLLRLANWMRPGDYSTLLGQLDLTAAIGRYKSEPNWLAGKKEGLALHEADGIRIVLMGLRANAMLDAGQVDCPQSVRVLEGKISFITNQKQMILEKAQAVELEADVKHYVVALEDSFYLLIMIINSAEEKKRCLLTKIEL